MGGVLASPIRSGLTALADAVRADAPFGPLGPPDALGVRVPPGFSVSLVGRSGDPLGRSGHRWHMAPDGGACFRVPGSNDTVYVSNSEVADGGGGVSAARVDRRGGVVDAWPILSGTSMNCSGGATPWGTWLSCEESGSAGLVWECDPFGSDGAIVRPALGAFNHEAVALDHVRKQLYLTEDRPDGRLYRFTPDHWPDLSAGRLEAASVDGDDVTWVSVSTKGPARAATTKPFDGGEGIVVDGSSLFFTTKGDRRVWELDLVRGSLRVFHDCVADPGTALTHVDNLALHPFSRDLFVAEDGGDMELCALIRGSGAPTVPPVVVPVVRFEGHGGSEVTGPAFTRDGRGLFVSSQRGTDGRGITVLVTGPFADWVGAIDRGADATRHAERLRPPGP